MFLVANYLEVPEQCLNTGKLHKPNLRCSRGNGQSPCNEHVDCHGTSSKSQETPSMLSMLTRNSSFFTKICVGNFLTRYVVAPYLWSFKWVRLLGKIGGSKKEGKKPSTLTVKGCIMNAKVCHVPIQNFNDMNHGFVSYAIIDLKNGKH